MKKFQTILASLIGWTALKTKDGQIDLSEEEKGSLFEKLGEEDATLLITTANEELSEVKSAKDQLAELKTQLEAATKNSNASLQDAGESNDVASENLGSMVEALQLKIKEQEKLINKLKDEPETPSSAGTMRNLAVAAGLATSVFAESGQILGLTGDHFKVEGRNWNERLLNPSLAATDFSNELVIDQLNRDFQGWVANYPSEIKSLFRDMATLPAHWRVISGVSDRMLTASIVVGEVTQPRKANWISKGAASIKAEVLRVFPVQIDLTFSYWQLQAIETNWLNSFNREGSQAYKMSFVQFLLVEYIKKARQEDRKVALLGVHVPTPEQHDRPVSYKLRGDGILKQAHDARIANKYRPFNVGLPTTSNILDYVNDMVLALPSEVRNQDLQFVLAPFWQRAYKNKYEETYNQATDYSGKIDYVKDYPNIKFVALEDLEGSDVMLITLWDNIVVLENIPAEKDLLTFEKSKRDINVFGDYKFGAGIVHIGHQAQLGSAEQFVVQSLWSNNVPFFNADFAVPFYGYEGTGVVEAKFNKIYPDESNTVDITQITGNVGNYLVVKGNPNLAASRKLKHGDGKLVLAGSADFGLKSTGYITLVKTAENVYKEIGRVATAPVTDAKVSFTGTAIDYTAGTEFVYTGASTATLADILNGAEGNVVRIYGGAAAGNALTIANVAGKISVSSSYVMDTNAKFMELIFVNGVWTEMARG